MFCFVVILLAVVLKGKQEGELKRMCRGRSRSVSQPRFTKSKAHANGPLRCHLHLDVFPSPLSYKETTLPAISPPLTTVVIIANTDHVLALSEAVFDSFCASSSGLEEFVNLQGDGGDAAEKWLSSAWNGGHLSPGAAFHHDAVLSARGLSPGLGIILADSY